MGFLTAWWLGPKTEHPERHKVKFYLFSFLFFFFLEDLGLDTDIAEFVPDSTGQAVTKPRFQGKAQRLTPLSGRSGKQFGDHGLKLPNGDEGTEAPRSLVTCLRSLQ